MSVKTVEQDFSTSHHSPFLSSDGFYQTLLLKRPLLPDSISCNESRFYLHDFANIFFDTCKEKHQQDIFFDSAVAHKTGYYIYRYHSIYKQDKIADSIFVTLPLLAPPVIPPLEPPFVESPDNQISLPEVVNLVVVDEKNLTYFKIFNIDEFEKVEVHLFSSSGKKIFSSLDYNNGFDMRNCREDTYYYTILASINGLRKIKKGFVQLHKK
ncbi:MAG: gliding motility-associated C-terminal domain-containing protein [Bacteroidales bacterium]|nr:gliding motility-associated C-terminal domain-containing protein [Bacteroidales bacterium]